ncbi:MAG: RAD55 family ATPase [Candidatus Sigynarchaeota archaeon]
MKGKIEQNKEPNRLPSAIIKLAKEPRTIILVKGSPGTGKTSLAMEIARIVGKAILVTFGRDSEAIKKRFPWVKQEALAVLDVSLQLKQNGTARATLAERVRELSIQISGLDASFSNALVILDDVGSFLSGLPPGDAEGQHVSFLEALRDTIDAPLLLVSDGERCTGIESRADAILALHDDLLDGRVMRFLEFVKFPSAPRRYKKIPFSLFNGRFTAGIALARVDIENSGKWIVAADPPGAYSTGSEKIDAIYNECFKLSSFNLMEIDPDLPLSACNFFLSAIINFLWQDRAVILAPVTGINTILLGKNDFPLFVEAEMMANNLRVLEERTGVITECRPYIVQLDNREKDLFKIFMEIYDSFTCQKIFSPLFSIIEFTSLDYRSDGMLKQILNHAKFVKNANVIEFAVVHSGIDSEFKAQLASIATTHTKLQAVEGDVILFTSMRPRSSHFFVELDTPIMPKIRLIPVL